MRNIILIILLLTGLSRAITPKDVKEAYQNSFTYEKISDYNNAIRALMPVLDAYPNGYTVNLRLGWLYYNNANLANSVHHYQQAIKIAPSSLEAKLGYIYPLLAMQKYEEAESVCYQIISVDYHNYYANLKLAYVLRIREKYELAEKVLLKMLTLYPIDLNFLSELALLKTATGDGDSAAKVYWDILTLDPENVAAKNYFNQKPLKK